MRIYICGIHEVDDFLDRARNQGHPVTRMLSLMTYTPPPFVYEPEVHDFIRVEDHERNHGIASPNYETLQKILNFGYKCDDDDLIVIHCMAGISRSTAAAMVILYDKYHDIDMIEQFIRAARPIAAPNRRICEFADRYFNSGTELFDLAEKLNQERGYIKLADQKLLTSKL